MRIIKLLFLLALCAGLCGGVVHQTLTYRSPVKKISGRVIGYGNVNPGVHVRIFDKPEVWSDDALSVVQKRKRQREIASTVTDATGKFQFLHIPKGPYEVEFSTRPGGWDVLSLFVVVDPSGSRKSLCVLISMESAGQKPSIFACDKYVSAAPLPLTEMGRLVGVVHSGRSLGPLRVSISKTSDASTSQNAKLSEKGEFEFDKVAPDEYVVNVTNDNGCAEYRTTVKIKAGTTVKLSIGGPQKLRPDLCE